MRRQYREITLRPKSREKLAIVNDIIRSYQRQGYVLTLRQLYYQLVSRDLIPNKDTEYKKLGVLVKEGRMGGIVDWDAIEDRLRRPNSPPSWDDPRDFLDSVVSQFAIDRMQGQQFYIEVWVEKDALSGVLSRITRPYHIPIMVNRGYSSASAMHDAYKRFERANDNNQSCVVLYLGDHDPSGLDMIRDIRDRVMEFFGNDDVDFFVDPIALGMDQIRQYNPPPNPAKITDPRAGDYIARHGNTSWEVDALPPETLNSILDNAIRQYVDVDVYDQRVELETEQRSQLEALKEHLE